jgi:hypothetical protein
MTLNLLSDRKEDSTEEILSAGFGRLAAEVFDEVAKVRLRIPGVGPLIRWDNKDVVSEQLCKIARSVGNTHIVLRLIRTDLNRILSFKFRRRGID